MATSTVVMQSGAEKHWHHVGMCLQVSLDSQARCLHTEMSCLPIYPIPVQCAYKNIDQPVWEESMVSAHLLRS